MTYDEFQRHVNKAGLKLHQFAELVQMNAKSLSNLKKQPHVPDHLAIIAVLMGEMAERGIDFRAPVNRIGLAPKKARGLHQSGQVIPLFGKGRQRAKGG